MTQMSTQVFFIESQAKDALLVPMSAISFAPARGMRQQDERTGERTGARMGERTGEQPPTDEQKAERKKRREAGENSLAMTAAAATENTTRPALIKVMDKNGNIEERNVLVGVTNRVQAQIIEGVHEGEKVISGSAKPNQVRAAPAGGMGGQGMGRR